MRRAELVVCIGIVNIFKTVVRTLEGEILFQKSVRRWKVDVMVDYKKKKKKVVSDCSLHGSAYG
jgi:hypothetical protein